jgi:hypothetical protein
MNEYIRSSRIRAIVEDYHIIIVEGCGLIIVEDYHLLSIVP